jgi:hypothetical protein
MTEKAHTDVEMTGQRDAVLPLVVDEHVYADARAMSWLVPLMPMPIVVAKVHSLFFSDWPGRRVTHISSMHAAVLTRVALQCMRCAADIDSIAAAADLVVDTASDADAAYTHRMEEVNSAFAAGVLDASAAVSAFLEATRAFTTQLHIAQFRSLRALVAGARFKEPAVRDKVVALIDADMATLTAGGPEPTVGELGTGAIGLCHSDLSEYVRETRGIRGLPRAETAPDPWLAAAPGVFPPTTPWHAMLHPRYVLEELEFQASSRSGLDAVITAFKRFDTVPDGLPAMPMHSTVCASELRSEMSLLCPIVEKFTFSGPPVN